MCGGVLWKGRSNVKDRGVVVRIYVWVTFGSGEIYIWEVKLFFNIADVIGCSWRWCLW